MKITCTHGYFKFEETQTGQLSDFTSRFGFEIARSGDHFTFADLVDAPDYSIAGGNFLGIPTLHTFEGPPWEVMRENGLVYNFALGLVVPILTVVEVANLSQAGNVLICNGMILPGSVMDDGSRVRDYAAFYLHDRASFRYSEVDSDD